MPAEVPDNWLVYFGAADVDAAVKKATDLGASVVVGPATFRVLAASRCSSIRRERRSPCSRASREYARVRANTRPDRPVPLR